MDKLDIKIIELLQQGKTVKQINQETGKSIATIYNRIHKMKHATAEFPAIKRKKNPTVSKRPKESLEKDKKILELKEQGISQNEIAEIVHINASGVSQRLKAMRESGIEIKEPKTENELMDDKILELRKKGMRISEIASALNSNTSTVSHRIQRMRQRGINVSKEVQIEMDSIDLQIDELKRKGFSQVQIAKQLGISGGCVSERVRKLKGMGLEFPEDEAGKNSIDKKIIEMRALGASNTEISNELGIGIVAVGKRIKKMRNAGVDVPESMTKKKQFDEIDKTIIELHEQGESPKAIAEKLNFTKGYASKRLRANGIRTRKHSPRPNRKKLKEVVGEEKLAKAILQLQESKKATKAQLKTIADYYGVDLNIVTKLAEYIEER